MPGKEEYNMLIFSHNLLSNNNLILPDNAIVRINVAWVKTEKELEELVISSRYDIYLDYPQGRTKPPKPVLKIESAIAIAGRFSKIKYFAVSNVEDPEVIHEIKIKLPKTVQLIPKIETKKGIENLELIARKIKPKYIMLDKEDLYIDVKTDSEEFEFLINLARRKGEECGLIVLELQGVVFSPRDLDKK